MLPTDTRAAAPDESSAGTWRRRLRRSAQLVLGTVLGLALVEAGFWLRDGGAFPHVNFYLADAELGARLEPGASMRFRLGDNPMREIHVNAQGFRGADWPAASATPSDAIMVVGDSQVFGLGVGDDETFSSRLGALTGRTVLNAGVPTYGPREYLALARELLEQREVGTLVYVVNFLNDPFELERPNTQRHGIWDGWAVRIETAPEPGTTLAFPGRRWLMSRSHAVYAARRWWFEREADSWQDTATAGLPSEGEWSDLLEAGARARIKEDTRTLEVETARRQSALADELVEETRRTIEDREAQLHAVRLELDTAETVPGPTALDRFYATISSAKPGDIVRQPFGEGSRDVVVTAKMYARALAAQPIERGRRTMRAAAYERQLEIRAEYDRLRERVDEDADGALIVDLERLSRQLRDYVPPPVEGRSVFDAHLRELADLCAEQACRLLIVALPFDVQVSHAEWAKYGVEDGPQMAGTLVLLDDMLADAARHGLAGFNASEVLRAAEPGAFLDGDIHMTARGHAALAEGIAAALAE